MHSLHNEQACELFVMSAMQGKQCVQCLFRRPQKFRVTVLHFSAETGAGGEQTWRALFEQQWKG